MTPLPPIVTDVPALPERAATTHKGQAGRVGIVAGSVGMSGAAVLCAQGALRGGAGLVRVACPAAIQPIVAAAEPCLMTVGLQWSRGGVEPSPFDHWPSVFAVGPGLGQRDDARELVRLALAHAPHRPIVLDADGLNILADQGSRDRIVRWVGAGADEVVWPAVITPHPGEMARLRAGLGLAALDGDDDETRVRVACECARILGTVVVLKGYRSVVCASDRAYVNDTGNPGMATGGMGDVLTGLIAALIGQGLSPFDAARLGVHVHGLAADRCAKEIAPVGYLARDVADRIPSALFRSRNARIGFH